MKKKKHVFIPVLEVAYSIYGYIKMCLPDLLWIDIEVEFILFFLQNNDVLHIWESVGIISQREIAESKSKCLCNFGRQCHVVLQRGYVYLCKPQFPKEKKYS